MKKFPDNAKLVFKGELFDTYQWEQKLYDGQVAIFEGVKRPDTAVVLAEMDGEICYTWQHQPQKEKPYYALLGGRIEEGEDPIAGAKREMLEEAGLASDDWELLLAYDPVGKMVWTVYLYIARNCRKVAEPRLDGGEKIEFRTATFDEFVKNILPSPNFYEIELKAQLLSSPNLEKIFELKEKMGL